MNRELRELIEMVRVYESLTGDAKTAQAIKIAEYLSVMRKKHFSNY